jgi:hypothetical protein
MLLRNIIYAFACLSFSIVIGGAVYEHMGVVPKWVAAPPASLSMFQGTYGLDPSGFWIIIHPVTLLLFSVTLILVWQSKSRPFLLVTFGGYIVILIITFIFFVPELIAITGTGYSGNIDNSLVQRAKLWETLSLIRLFFLVVLSIVLFLGLTRIDSFQRNT